MTESCVKTIADGATPNVTSSAKESSSLPIGELTPSSRALIPSKKSNTAPAMIHTSASWASPHKANKVAMQPDTRLPHVRVFGILLVIKFAI